MTVQINKLKYKGDDYTHYEDLLVKSSGGNNQDRIELLYTSLKVSKDITPSLFKMVSRIEKNLNLKDVNIEYYVYSNPEINAGCFSIKNDSSLIVLITSTLVNLMNENELSFVIGHEIGHYLFDHLKYRRVENNQYLLKYYQSQEISADRIGLICSGSIENSVRAIVKTISGLGDEFISKNLYTFLHQHNEIDGEYVYASTHPTLPTRAKALTLFSMSEIYYDWIGETKKEAPLENSKLDQSIEGYLNKTSLKELNDEKNRNLGTIKMWTLAKYFMETKSLKNDGYNILKDEYGEEKAGKVIKYCLSHEIEDIDKKIDELSIDIRDIDSKYKTKLQKDIKKLFKKHNFNTVIKE